MEQPNKQPAILEVNNDHKEVLLTIALATELDDEPRTYKQALDSADVDK